MIFTKIFSTITSWVHTVGDFFTGATPSAPSVGKIDKVVVPTEKCGTVFLTVDSSGKNELELNWINAGCGKDGLSLIRLQTFDMDMAQYENGSDSGILAYAYAKDHPDGYKRSGVYLKDEHWPNEWRFGKNQYIVTGSMNFPFYIASFDENGKIIDIQPLKLEPTWMFDNREKLTPLRVGDLAIPGTLDSGCYKGYGLYHNYIYTQDFTIWEQLVLGIRYLDLRVAYYVPDNTFYIKHDFVYIRKLQSVYDQIWEFMKRSPNEVIILDFNRFPYPEDWSDSLHHKLLNYTIDFFSPYIVPKSKNQKGSTLGEIWESNQKVILAYGESKFVSEYEQLWSPVYQAWPNTINKNDFKTFLEKAVNSDDNKFRTLYSLMAELTPKVFDLVFRTNILRKLADQVNRELTKWIRDEWSDKVNIIATDFFLGNNIIQVAIDINRNKKPKDS